jgi:hypothetical protein
LREYLAKVSHREHLLWVAYLNEEWESPDPHAWYMMSIAAEVRRVLAANPGAIKVEDFRLKFKVAPAALQSREMSSWSRAIWAARVGLTGREEDS